MSTLMSHRPVPALVGLVFGGLWGSVAVSALPPAARAGAMAMVVLVTVALMILVWRRPAMDGPRGRLFGRRPYLMAVAAEVAAIYAASVLMPRFALQGYFVQAVGVIVGLHFLGLWRASRLTRYVWIAGGMCAVSLVAMALPEKVGAVHLRDGITGLGNALILWFGAGLAVRHRVPPSPEALDQGGTAT